MTLPLPQAEDALTKCSGYLDGQVPLSQVRIAVGEAAAAADGALQDLLAWATSGFDTIEEGSDQERQEADPVVREVMSALRDYMERSPA